MQVFPVAGPSAFMREFTAQHRGIDIFADADAPVRAPDAGSVRFGTDPLGGNVFNLLADDGTHYYGAHLSRAEGANRRVSAGDVVGYVGTTGNAKGTHPHLHLEVRTPDGAAVDPYDALAAVAPPEAKPGTAPYASPSSPAPAPAKPAPAPARAAGVNGWLVLALLWLVTRKGRMRL